MVVQVKGGMGKWAKMMTEEKASVSASNITKAMYIWCQVAPAMDALGV